MSQVHRFPFIICQVHILDGIIVKQKKKLGSAFSYEKGMTHIFPLILVIVNSRYQSSLPIKQGKK